MVALTCHGEPTQAFGSRLPCQQLPVGLLKALQVDMQAPGPPPPLTQVLILMVSLPPSWVPQHLLWSSMGLSLYLSLHIEKSNATVGTQIFDRDDIVHYVLATHLEPCLHAGLSFWAASRWSGGQEVAPRDGGIRTTLSALWTDQAQMWLHLSKSGLYHRPRAISTAVSVGGQGSFISHRKPTIPPAALETLHKQSYTRV